MRCNDDWRWEPIGPVLPTPAILADDSDRAVAVLRYVVLPKQLNAEPMDRLVAGETAEVLMFRCEQGDQGHQVLVDYVEGTFGDHQEERIAANEVWLVMPLEPDSAEDDP